MSAQMFWHVAAVEVSATLVTFAALATVTIR